MNEKDKFDVNMVHKLLAEKFYKLEDSFIVLGVPYHNLSDKNLNKKSMALGNLMADLLVFMYSLKRMGSRLDVAFFSDDDDEISRVKYDRVKNILYDYFKHMREMTKLAQSLNNNITTFLDREF